MVRTEYKISGEGDRVVEEDRGNFTEESPPQDTATASSADDLPQLATPADAFMEGMVGSTWAHHAHDGRVDPNAVAEALGRIEASDLPPALQEALRTHLLAHQRAAAAFEKKRSLKRG